MENLQKLGIDPAGILVYLVNFGLLWAVMAYLVFPKIIRLIDQRRHQIESNLSTAERIQAELDQSLEAARQEKADLSARVQAELAELQRSMAAERSQMLQDMETERTQLLDEARAMIKAEKKQVLAATESESLALIQRVLIRVLGEKVDPEDVAASVKQLWEETKQEVNV